VLHSYKLPSTTVRNWANGYTIAGKYKQTKQRGVLRSDRSEPYLFNFYELIELLYVKELTREREGSKPYATLKEVRDMVDFLAEEHGEYPLAQAQFHKVMNQIVTENKTTSLLTNPILAQHLLDFAHELVVQLDFDDGMVSTWYPCPDKIVRVNPLIRFGQPIIEDGVTCETIYLRFNNRHETEDEIAEDLNIPVERVKAAIKFEEEWLSGKAA